MKTYNISFFSFFVAVLTAVIGCTGCSSYDKDEPLTDPLQVDVPEAVEVPVEICLATVWNFDEEDLSRAVPPGVGGGTTGNSGDETGSSSTDGLDAYASVDRVQLTVFRRKVKNENNEKDWDPNFYHDIANDMTLEVKSVGGDFQDDFADSQYHKVATGKLKKVYGYEYKVVAVAYSSYSKTQYHDQYNVFEMFGMTDGDLGRFHFDFGASSSYSEFKAVLEPKAQNKQENYWKAFFGAVESTGDYYHNQILNEYAIEVPQLFYGECFTEFDGRKSEVIQFAESDVNGESVKNLGIRGILFRGMAKIEVHFDTSPYRPALTDYPIEWVGLLADKVYTAVGLRNYDDFLQGSRSFTDSIKNKDKNGVFTLIGYKSMQENEVGRGVIKTIETYILPCKGRLALRVGNRLSSLSMERRNGWLNAGSKDWDGAVNGTGIVSPDSHDGYFYFRRNHKYVIHVSDMEKFLGSKDSQIPYVSEI